MTLDDVIDISIEIFNVFLGIFFFCFLPAILLVSLAEDKVKDYIKKNRYEGKKEGK